MHKIRDLQREIASLKSEIEHLRNVHPQALRMYEEALELEPYQAELIKLQSYIEDHGKRMIILFEGRDAAGKGTLIGTVSRYMNPKHYRIVALGKPSEEQKTQWYFQKYVEHFPSAGEIILFDRSWYNRAMVEPVFGFCTQEEYDLFMSDVGGFENSLTKQGIILIKLYLSVKRSVQAERFERRRVDPLRQWKLSEVDLQAQEMWDEFSKMKHKMLMHQTSNTPWHVIRSNDRHKARIEAIKLILNHVDYDNRNPDLDYTRDKKVIVSVDQELSMMKKTRPDLFGPQA